MTNYEHMMSLSLPQLARFLDRQAPVCMGETNDCEEALRYWLSLPVESEDNYTHVFVSRCSNCGKSIFKTDTYFQVNRESYNTIYYCSDCCKKATKGDF